VTRYLEAGTAHLSLMGDGTKPGTTFVPRETLNVPTFVPKVRANYKTKV
jgi:hypothetical protein